MSEKSPTASSYNLLSRQKKLKKEEKIIDKYYTSLFTAVVSITPFIDKIPVKNCIPLTKYDTIHILLCFLSVIALTFSFS